MKISLARTVFFVLIGIIVIALLFASSLKKNQVSSNYTQGIKVAATIFPLYDIVRFIGDENVAVTLLLPEGESPDKLPAIYSNTDFTPLQTIFAVGHGLDVQGLPDALADHLVIVDTDVDLILQQGSTGNPYYWLSPKETMHIADTVTKKLAQLDPVHAADFEKRRTQLQTVLAALDKNIRELLGQLPTHNVAIYGYDWSYFAREYGLSMVWYAPEGGISATDQADVTKLISKFGIRTIFSDVTLDPGQLLPITLSERVAIENLDALGGIENHTTYAATMAANAKTIFENLNTVDSP